MAFSYIYVKAGKVLRKRGRCIAFNMAYNDMHKSLQENEINDEQ